MKKYVCTVCGYIAEGSIPEQCPVCKAPASAFVEKTGNTYVTEHRSEEHTLNSSHASKSRMPSSA